MLQTSNSELKKYLQNVFIEREREKIYTHILFGWIEKISKTYIKKEKKLMHLYI